MRKRTYKAIRAMRRDLRRRRGKPKPQLPPAALKFDIGRDTARMLRSLAVAVGEEFANPDTAVESIGGTLSVGTNVPYARWFHEGRPGVQEPRPLVPADGTIPDAWWPAIMAAAIRGIMAAIEYMVRVGYKP